MRTTLTLDDDVAARLEEKKRKTGLSFKEVVNQTLREGLAAPRSRRPQKPFRIRARALGLRPGLTYDNVGELLEQIEGPAHR